MAQTFSMGRLAPDCASTQFNEDLSKLPDQLLTAKFESCSRLARTLHSFTLAEMGIFRYPELEFLKVLTTSMVCSLRHDLFELAVARHNCSKHVLQHASIRHEPTKLINDPLWETN